MNGSRHQQEDGGYAMLMSIIALLFALGDDAERAAFLPDAERYRLLWILRPAEAVARKLALEAAWYPDLCDLPPPTSALTDDSPAAALRLAHCFRAVAVMLGALVMEFAPGRQAAFAGHHPKTRLILLALPDRLSRFSRLAPARLYPDTS